MKLFEGLGDRLKEQFLASEHLELMVALVALIIIIYIIPKDWFNRGK